MLRTAQAGEVGTGCSCQRTAFSSRHSHGSSQLTAICNDSSRRSVALFRGLQAPGMHGMKIDTCVGKTVIHTQFLKQANLKGHSKRKRTENGQSQRRVSPTCPHQGTKSAISHSPTDQNADTALYCGYKEHSYFTSTLPPPSETQGSTFLSQFSRTRIPGSKLTVNPKTTAVEESRPKHCPGSTSGLLPSSSALTEQPMGPHSFPMHSSSSSNAG